MRRCEIIVGDAVEVLKGLPEGSVHSCVTSPPYWGLRDYGVAGQIGLEGAPEEFVEALVRVFREVRRVLRGDGTLWLNIGDCWASSGGAGWQGKHGARANRTHAQRSLKGRSAGHGLKNKDLVGVPWMVAFALRNDGWWLRQDIVWSKLNPMPSSVRDRCTPAHEYLFLLSKSERYHFDASAIAEPCVAGDRGSRFDSAQDLATKPGLGMGERARSVPASMMPPIGGTKKHPGNNGNATYSGEEREWTTTRNKRSVWTISTQPFPEAHFATFPEALVEPCVLAGCPAGGTVLDPFAGAGTTGLVAVRLGRGFVGMELNPEYAAMARRRVEPEVMQGSLI